TVSEPKPKKQRRTRTARAPRVRRERPDVGAAVGTRPWATLTLVLLSLFGYLLLSVVARSDVAVAGPVDGQWWRAVVSPFVYGSAWYELAALIAIGTFGWLLEQRHGPFTVLGVFLLCGAGGIALTAAIDHSPLALGGNGAGLVLLLMPLAVPEASAIAGFAGAALGLLCGLALARTRRA